MTCCAHHFIWELGERVCDRCGHVVNGLLKREDEYRENILVRRHYIFQPAEFLANKADLLAGMKRPWQMWDITTTRRELRKAGTWFQVYEQLAKRGGQEHFLCVPAIMGHPVRLGAFCKGAYEVIYQEGFKIKFPYLCFKWRQLMGQTDLWIPVKCRKATHTRNEKEWRRVCDFFGVPFIPTQFEDLVTPWNVHAILNP